MREKQEKIHCVLNIPDKSKYVVSAKRRRSEIAGPAPPPAAGGTGDFEEARIPATFHIVVVFVFEEEEAFVGAFLGASCCFFFGDRVTPVLLSMIWLGM
jgi:hypothetical protein